MKFTDLRTRAKLGLGFGLIIFLTALIALVGTNGISTYHKASIRTKHINWAESYFINARLNARTLVHLKQESDYKKALANSDSARQNIDLLLATYPNDEDKKAVEKMKEDISTYIKSLEALHLLIEEDINLTSEIKELGDNIGQSVGTSNPNLLIARMNYLYYRTYNDKDAIGRAVDAMQKIKASSSGATAANAEKYISKIINYGELEPKLKSNEEHQREIGRALMNELNGETTVIANEADSTKDYVMASMIIIATIALGLGLFIAWIVSQYLTKYIQKGVKLAETYASGDLTVVVPEEDLLKKDEIGDLARAMVGMGNKLKDIIAAVLVGSENISGASMQTSSASQTMSQGATEQASSVEEISSTMEEMAANIQQNSDNATQTETIAHKVSLEIEQVGTAANESLQSVKNIADKIAIINDIAFQTNILALNAAVEAARAGEHGKGFAVVAAEVRKLAERSKIAADEIVVLSTQSVKATEVAAELLNKQIPQIEKTAKLVQEVAAASIEQNNGASQINNAIQQLNNITQQNAAASEELATSSEELASQAEQLKEMIAYFKVDAASISHKPPYSETKKAATPTKKVTPTIPSPKPVNRVHIKLNNKHDEDYEQF